ncbi:MAG TPA: hypothetical protein VK083_22355 [Nocardia sp.]|uniref:hypothetical protein n=1 Tax=Nocardia sp. TaxID=1821 RepID=UPI002B4B3FE8|nr:hypothetical protein [Nocardia sp.]HLS79533.1 hypothetical protein [Nocardia sp.]
MTTAVMVGAVALTAAVGCADGGEPEGPDLSAPPTDVRWQPYQGVALPHTAQGPRSVSGGAATGFEHSPAGAAVAAITHTVRLSVAPDGEWASVVAEEALPGPARDAWAVDRVRVSITGPADPEFVPRLRGYRVTGYTGERGQIEIYTEYSDGSLAVNHAAVEWSARDWRLRLPDPDSTDRPVEAVGALPGDIVTLEAPK